MTLDPTNYTTWTTFGDHPIFGEAKAQIASWSLDSSCYSDLDYYGQFMPEYYVHVDPAPPLDEQLEIAERDIRNLAMTCALIEQAFGPIKYELVILDDFTAYVWIEHSQFAVEIYPNASPSEEEILKLFIDVPDVRASEHECHTIKDLIEVLRETIGY